MPFGASNGTGGDAVWVVVLMLASPAVDSVAQTCIAPIASWYGADWKPPMVEAACVRTSIRVTVADPLFATHAALESSVIELGPRPTGIESRTLPLPGSTTPTLFVDTRRGEEPLAARTLTTAATAAKHPMSNPSNSQ
jgi:hypothetical protein